MSRQRNWARHREAHRTETRWRGVGGSDGGKWRHILLYPGIAAGRGVASRRIVSAGQRRNRLASGFVFELPLSAYEKLFVFPLAGAGRFFGIDLAPNHSSGSRTRERSHTCVGIIEIEVLRPAILRRRRCT